MKSKFDSQDIQLKFADKNERFKQIITQTIFHKSNETNLRWSNDLSIYSKMARTEK